MPTASTWLAVAAWAGALVALPVPLVVGPLLLVVAIGWRRHWAFWSRSRVHVAHKCDQNPVALVALGLFLLTSALAVRATDSLVPAEAVDFDGEVALASDPSYFGASLRVDVRIGGQRIEAWARGPEAARLSSRLMGERVELAGRIVPAPPDGPWLARRQVLGRLSVAEVGEWRTGDPASRAANGLRRTLSSGSQVMERDTRSLYAGLLLGDQRDQGPVVADAFRGSGLTHLLAVSGQNVAFVLVIVGPLLRRLRLGPRLFATIAVLAFFALVTRFEPSVLRATTMAGFAAMAVTFGREADSRRMLALAVVALLLIDPLIAGQLAFQLSVAATVGILLWSARIAAALPGPKVLATAVAVTVAAQVAVSPLLIPTFGGMPVSALLANVLAAPMTGPVVVWGLPAGLLAGATGGRTSEWLHTPTSFMVDWIATVAEWCANLPLGEVGTSHLLVGAGGVAAVWLGRRRQLRVPAVVGVLIVAGALVHPAVALRMGPPPVTTFEDGSRLHAAGRAAVLELDLGARPDVVLEGLRRKGVTRIDVVVALHGGRDVAETVAVLRQRAEPRLVLAPKGHRVPNGSVAVEGSVITVGALDIHVRLVTDRLDVEVVSQRGDATAGRRSAPIQRLVAGS